MRQIKSLTTDIAQTEQANLQMVGQLRMIDALLLQFYSTKQRRQQQQQQRQAKTAENSHDV